MSDNKVDLKIVADNEASEGFIAEHGFSLWVQTTSKTIFFDTGQGAALLKNAQQLNLNLPDTDAIVLSHGHYDHTGGLVDLLNQATQAEVYCHAAAFLPRYSIEDSIAKPIKITAPAMAAINSLTESRLHWVTKHTMLTENIGITGEIPRHTSFETTGGAYYFDQDGKRADAIIDDIALWLRTPKGLVICIGCCHAGIINTLNYVMQLSGVKKIHTVIGGLHLPSTSDDQLTKTISELKKMDIGRIIPCHCTNEQAHTLISSELNCTRGFAGFELSI